jgi:hypothetical protein
MLAYSTVHASILHIVHASKFVRCSFYNMYNTMSHRSKNDMDALYRKFTTKIQSEEEELTRKNDNMLEKSQSLDAKFTALREQNKVSDSGLVHAVLFYEIFIFIGRNAKD